MRHSGALFTFALGFTAWVVACVGTDPGPTNATTTPAAGDRLGACYPNKTCNAGFECREPELICLTPGEPVPPDAGSSSSGGSSSGASSSGASSSGGSSSGASSSGGSSSGANNDGGSQCTISTLGGTGTFCGSQGRCGQACCSATANLACTTAGACEGAGFACDGDTINLCGAGMICCATAPVPAVSASAPTTGCSGSVVVLAHSDCSPMANPCAFRQLCRTPDDCNGGGCTPREIQLNGANEHVVWGVCD